MAIKSFLQRLRQPGWSSAHNPDVLPLEGRSTAELLALMRHESHRVEKAAYNDVLESKRPIYKKKLARIRRIHEILQERGVSHDEPTWRWSRAIANNFDDLEGGFVAPNSRETPPFEPEKAEEFVEFLRSRRSTRVWADEQPSEEELRQVARAMLDGARWAPNSGNRQSWRFRIITDSAEKELLRVVKERHTLSAPLLIFVGTDTRVYGALGVSERSIYLDPAAAIMQMALVAHSAGLGVCWNHFADDLLESREANRACYDEFARVIGIPSHIAPIAIVAIGRPAFVSPEVSRTRVDDLLL